MLEDEGGRRNRADQGGGAVKQFSEAMTYFEKQRCTDPDEAKKNVRQLPSKSAKVAWLQAQNNIRTKG